MLTTQEIFDKVAGHLLKQGQRSLIDARGCAYRGKNGMMCAAGCLIEDTEYSSEFEGLTWSLLPESVKSRFSLEGNHLISSLQVIHDHDKPVIWKISLNRLAEKYNLKGIP